MFPRIMMLSVLKHTKNPVKFWFLKNFLSPTFKVNSLSVCLCACLSVCLSVCVSVYM